MKYRKIYPSEKLKNYVKCYYVWEGKLNNSNPLIIESPPTGYTALVINYGDPYYIFNGLKTTLLPRLFVTGQATEIYSLKFLGEIGILGIVFKPTGLFRLLNTPISQFTDQRFDLVEMMGNCSLELLEQVATTPYEIGKVQVVEHFLFNKLLCEKTTAFDRAANFIDENNGIIRISELSKIYHIGRRQLGQK
jgi:hypothetical protein